MKKPRMCSRFFCDAVKERRCCADCSRAYRCARRCLNDPKRCGLVEGKPKKKLPGGEAKISRIKS